MALKLRDFLLSVCSFPSIADDPFQQRPFFLHNFTGGWEKTLTYTAIPNPLSGACLAHVPDTQPDELETMVRSMNACPPYGLHNPLYRKERYALYGKIFARAADTFATPEVADYFARLINVVMPKGYEESMAEVTVVRDFLYNLAGDGCRNLGMGVTTPGNRTGQEACSYLWPYGPVAVITPFNFPLEIPVLQVCGALAMGNKPLLKPDQRVAVVAEAFVRLLLACGMPADDMCLLHAGGATTEHLITMHINGNPLIRFTQFTGSTKIAKRLLRLTEGRVKIEDSGFNWKILGPNFFTENVESVARQCDKDAYGASGQKCSAQSLLITHRNWTKAGLWKRLAELAKERKIGDLSIGPILSWSDQRIARHVKKLAHIPGAVVLFGGRPIRRDAYSIPSQYGCYQPTAVYVPLHEIMNNFDLVTTEVFAPVQIVTGWETPEDLDLVIDILNRIGPKLTAGIVDRDVTFVEYVAGRTTNGTTYAGILGKTTGAPQWHWFGPASHPASAGIGTPEAIRLVWTTHREIIKDWGITPYYGKE